MAAHLAGHGLSVVLLERDRFPRDKLCGEFLSPESKAELERLGVLEEIVGAAPHPIDRARFYSEAGRSLFVPLPGTGYGLSRRRLDAILFERARRAGVEAIEDAEVIGIDGPRVSFVRRKSDTAEVIEAKLVVCAHGRRSRLDKALARPFMDRAHPFVAMKRHHRASSALRTTLERTVEIHAFDGGYCGMSFIETGEVNACALFTKRFLDAREAKDWPNLVHAMCQKSATLAQRFRELEPSDEAALAVAQIPFEEKARYEDGGRRLFIGDAAGMIAPLAGDGQAMALASARIASEIVIGSTLDDPERIGRMWDRAWRKTFDRRMKLGRLLQRALFRPSAADLLIRGIGAIPGLAATLAKATRG
jgi:flavin-dependent dehydrogenase